MAALQIRKTKGQTNGSGKILKFIITSASEQLSAQFLQGEFVSYDKLELSCEFETFRERHSVQNLSLVQLGFLTALSDAFRFLDSGQKNYQFVKGLCAELVPQCLGTNNKALTQSLPIAIDFALKNNKRAGSGFLYLFMPFVLVASDKTSLEKIRIQFAKRRATTVPAIYIQRHIIIRFMLEQAQLVKHGASNDPEVSLARFMCLAAGKQKKFHFLLKDIVAIRSRGPASFIAYLEELRELSELYGFKELELILLKELTLRDVFFTDNMLARMDLLNDTEARKKTYFHRLLLRFKKQQDWNLNKTITLLVHMKDYLGILDLIKRYKGYFVIAQKAAMQVSPDLSREHMKVYVFQLLSMMDDAREPFHQKQLFAQVSNLLDRLLDEDADFMLGEMLRQIGRNNYIYTLLKEYTLKRGLNLPA